jgi:hypothetical protein
MISKFPATGGANMLATGPWCASSDDYPKTVKRIIFRDGSGTRGDGIEAKASLTRSALPGEFGRPELGLPPCLARDVTPRARTSDPDWPPGPSRIEAMAESGSRCVRILTRRGGTRAERGTPHLASKSADAVVSATPTCRAEAAAALPQTLLYGNRVSTSDFTCL